jgi:putative flavoprotein involved in K+ transport
MTEHIDTVVIGSGQAGLSAGYHLRKQNRPFVILEAGDRVGGSWWSRWDSMRLFTPSTHDGLPGMPFPSSTFSFPSRDEMTAYLQAYAERFELPVRTGVRVDGLFREDDRYVLTAGGMRIEADNVIVATGAHRRPKLPDFAAHLAPSIVAMHSVDYRNPAQLSAGDVLVVGPGNSGADISLELAKTHRTMLSGTHPGQLPIRIGSWQGRTAFPLIWFTWSHILTLGTPVGRKARPKIVAKHEPLIRVKAADLDAAGVERTPRVVGIVDGCPQLEDGRVLDVANVIWATGFLPDYGWIDLPGLDTSGDLDNERGAVTGQPGLYVLGQHFQYMFNSHTVGGVGKDAKHVVKQIGRRPKQAVSDVTESGASDVERELVVGFVGHRQGDPVSKAGEPAT